MKIAILPCYVFLSLCLSLQGQGVKISNTGTQPDASAQLEVESTNKGILIPQVDLQDATDGITVASPASSLLVFNTGNTLSPSGYYYNGGTPQSPQWILVFTSPAQDTLDMGTNPVVNVPLPVNPNDAVNKDYVDNALLASGGSYTMISNESAVGMNFGAAIAYCRNLNESGYQDWQLPTYESLTELASRGGTYFTNPTSSNYVWTNSIIDYNGSYGEYQKVLFRFSDGYTARNTYSTNLYVRCIR